MTGADPDAPDDHLELLPEVPEAYVRERLSKAGGNELESGKFASPVSSAALAVNAFAWFHPRPSALPVFPGAEGAGWPALAVDIERCVRFPWSGGKHPWLDAFAETSSHILGIESKRHEPFRGAKKARLSSAYDRPVWGPAMEPFEVMRDRLNADPRHFRHLDAAQLVKHAFGLIIEARRLGKTPWLIYLYDEPACWTREAIDRHRAEVFEFERAVQGAALGFIALPWRNWLDDFWTGSAALLAHRERVRERFFDDAPPTSRPRS